MIGGRERRNARTRDFGRYEAAAKGELRENRELVGGIDAFDVVRRIGLGESQPLSLREGACVRRSVEHLRKNEVGRAVEHAPDFENIFTREGFGERAHDRNRTSDGRLVRDRHAVRRG